MNLASVIVSVFVLHLSISHVHCEGDAVTEEEETLVAQLRPLVANFLYKDYMNKTSYLARFLRVRENDVGRARDLVKELMIWRKKEKVDTILTEDLSAIDKLIPVVFEGTDKYGRPLAMLNVGVVDIRKIVLSGQIETFLRFFLVVLELMEATAREVQVDRPNVTRAYLIIDLANFNLRQHWCSQCIQFIPYIFNTYENYYPDRFHRVVFLNTPRTFIPIFELVRPFLSAPSRRAVRLLDYNQENWKKALREDIEEDQLPILYGGTKKTQAKTLSYYRKHDKYLKGAFERAEEELKKMKMKTGN